MWNGGDGSDGSDALAAMPCIALLPHSILCCSSAQVVKAHLHWYFNANGCVNHSDLFARFQSTNFYYLHICAQLSPSLYLSLALSCSLLRSFSRLTVGFYRCFLTWSTFASAVFHLNYDRLLNVSHFLAYLSMNMSHEFCVFCLPTIFRDENYGAKNRAMEKEMH